MRQITLLRVFLLLVVLGLIGGTVLMLQGMDRRAAVQALVTDQERMMAAMVQFRSKYAQMPGDLDRATSLWGRDPTCPVYDDMPPDTNPVTPEGTCNGDSDGLVESTAMLPTTTSEFFQFWRHLALARMIDGNYTGLTGSNYAQCILGENCPALGRDKQATAIATEFNWEGTGTNGWWGTATVGRGNWLVIGAPTDGLSWPFVPLLSAKEQQALDTKTDDGKPGQGNLMAMGCQLYQSGCMVDAEGQGPGTDCDAFAAVAQYQTAKPGPTCTPMWRFTMN